MSDETAATLTKRWRRIRVRAVLAAGLVLGSGAAFTLASWSDSENAQGAFAASVFDTQSSVQGGAYADNHTMPGPIVTFAQPGLAPGLSDYFSVLIRTTTGSTGGTMILNGATLSGSGASTLGAAIVYRVVATTSTCGASAFGAGATYIVGSASASSPLTTGQDNGVSNTLAAATASAPGPPTGFCFQLTLPTGVASSLQDQTVSIAWQIVATST